MLQLLNDEFVDLSMDAFNDRLLFLLSFRSLNLLTLLLTTMLSLDGDEWALIALAFRRGNDMLRIFSSCLRSTSKRIING